METGDLTWEEILEEAGNMTIRPKYPAPDKTPENADKSRDDTQKD